MNVPDKYWHIKPLQLYQRGSVYRPGFDKVLKQASDLLSGEVTKDLKVVANTHEGRIYVTAESNGVTVEVLGIGLMAQQGGEFRLTPTVGYTWTTVDLDKDLTNNNKRKLREWIRATNKRWASHLESEKKRKVWFDKMKAAWLKHVSELDRACGAAGKPGIVGEVSYSNYIKISDDFGASVTSRAASPHPPFDPYNTDYDNASVDPLVRIEIRDLPLASAKRILKAIAKEKAKLTKP